MADPLQSGVTEWGDNGSVNGPTEVAKTTRELMRRSVLRYASAGERDAAMTTAGFTTPASMRHLVCSLDTDPAALYKHDGTAWRRLFEGVRWVFGITNVTFTNGVGTLTHNIGVTPTQFFIMGSTQSQISGSHQVRRATVLTATTVELFGWLANGTVISSGTAVGVQWSAVIPNTA